MECLLEGHGPLKMFVKILTKILEETADENLIERIQLRQSQEERPITVPPLINSQQNILSGVL